MLNCPDLTLAYFFWRGGTGGVVSTGRVMEDRTVRPEKAAVYIVGEFLRLEPQLSAYCRSGADCCEPVWPSGKALGW